MYVCMRDKCRDIVCVYVLTLIYILCIHTYIYIQCIRTHTAAPWNKLSGDVGQWLQAEKEEYSLKLKYLKKTNRGLMRKDLINIKLQMEVCIYVCACVCV